MHLVLGPILIIVGMFLLGLIEFNMGGGGMGQGLQKRVDAMGIWGSLLLGIVFALTFCPTSAALFFGSLVPLSLKVNSSFTLPIVYGEGLLAGHGLRRPAGDQAQSVGKAYNVLAKIEWWARMLTGAIFVLVGIYFALKRVFR